MIKFKNEGIDFARSELKGTEQLAELIEKNKNGYTISDFDVLISTFTQIANESKLILDPDLDSYYTMTLLVQHLPKLLSKLVSLSSESITPEEKKLILLQIHEEKSDIHLATGIINAEDKNFYNVQAASLIEESMKFESELNNDIQNILANKGNKNFPYLFSYWDKLNHYLREMLNSRIEQISRDRQEAVLITSVIWLLSIISAVVLMRKSTKSQKKLDKQLQEKTAALISTSKFSALGEMSAAFAHEVNTPLATILLRTEQIANSINSNNPKKDEITLQSLSSIQETINTISKIIQGLKTISRQSDNDPMTLNSALSLAHDTLALCSEKLKIHSIEATTVVKAESADNLNFYCRPAEIIQVLINLICNASDAIAELKNPWIQIVIEDLKNDVKVSVIDSGHGIPMAVQEKMMSPFFTTKPVGKGTGLGLSISKRIITNHKGKLFVDNTHNNTCISFQIPKKN